MLMRELHTVGRQAKQIGEKQERYVLMIDALKRTADALKSACADNVYKTFITHYGGDEFIIVAKTAGIGYSHYNGGIDEFQSAMSEADEALYRDKKAAG